MTILQRLLLKEIQGTKGFSWNMASGEYENYDGWIYGLLLGNSVGIAKLGGKTKSGRNVLWVNVNRKGQLRLFIWNWEAGRLEMIFLCSNQMRVQDHVGDETLLNDKILSGLPLCFL